jgi:peptide deformylase
MKRLKRTQFGNPILRQKSKAVPVASVKKVFFKKLINEMFFTMRRVKGVGLAAPQINKSIQLAVIQIKKSKIRPEVKPLPATIIINPRITSISKEKDLDWEGCLSFPNVRGLVPRYSCITVEYINEKGEKQKVKLEGFQARVFQHEIDHLKGILYIDRMSDMKKLVTLSEFKERFLKKGLKSK